MAQSDALGPATRWYSGVRKLTVLLCDAQPVGGHFGTCDVCGVGEQHRLHDEEGGQGQGLAEAIELSDLGSTMKSVEWTTGGSDEPQDN